MTNNEPEAWILWIPSGNREAFSDREEAAEELARYEYCGARGVVYDNLDELLRDVKPMLGSNWKFSDAELPPKDKEVLMHTPVGGVGSMSMQSLRNYTGIGGDGDRYSLPYWHPGGMGTAGTYWREKPEGPVLLPAAVVEPANTDHHEH